MKKYIALFFSILCLVFGVLLIFSESRDEVPFWFLVIYKSLGLFAIFIGYEVFKVTIKFWRDEV